MKPSLKQQFVSQEPGKVDCNGGRREAEGDWLLELPPLVLEALFNSKGYSAWCCALLSFTRPLSFFALLDSSHFIKQLFPEEVTLYNKDP